MTQQESSFGTDFIARQRDRLLAMQRELLEANTGQHPEGVDAASSKGLLDFNNQRLGDIQRALQKIEEGTYGLSDESGEQIPPSRLEAFPDALYTEREQEELELGK